MVISTIMHIAREIPTCIFVDLIIFLEKEFWTLDMSTPNFADLRDLFSYLSDSKVHVLTVLCGMSLHADMVRLMLNKKSLQIKNLNL